MVNFCKIVVISCISTITIFFQKQTFFLYQIAVRIKVKNGWGPLSFVIQMTCPSSKINMGIAFCGIIVNGKSCSSTVEIVLKSVPIHTSRSKIELDDSHSFVLTCIIFASFESHYQLIVLGKVHSRAWSRWIIQFLCVHLDWHVYITSILCAHNPKEALLASKIYIFVIFLFVCMYSDFFIAWI